RLLNRRRTGYAWHSKAARHVLAGGLIEFATRSLIEPNPHVLVFVAGGFLLIGGICTQAGRIAVHVVAKFQHLHPAIIELCLGRKRNALQSAVWSLRLRAGPL